MEVNIWQVADLFPDNFYLGHIFSFGAVLFFEKIPRDQKTPIAIYR